MVLVGANVVPLLNGDVRDSGEEASEDALDETAELAAEPYKDPKIWRKRGIICTRSGDVCGLGLVIRDDLQRIRG